MRKSIFWSCLIALFLTVFSRTGAQQEKPLFAQITDIQGDVYVGYSFEETELSLINSLVFEKNYLWTKIGFAEIRFPEKIFLRLDEKTKIRIENLNLEEYGIRLIEGAIYLSLKEEKKLIVYLPEILLREKNCRGSYSSQVEILGPAVVFLKFKNKKLEIRTEKGVANFRALNCFSLTIIPQEEFLLKNSQWKKQKLSRWKLFKLNNFDFFFDYHKKKETASETYSLTILEKYGRWLHWQGKKVWIPNLGNFNFFQNWQPYWYGRWVFYPYYGWVWVPYEIWGWITYHYGYWIWTPSFSWVWVPDENLLWHSNLVYWFWDEEYIGWYPRWPNWYLNWYQKIYNDWPYKNKNITLRVVRKNALEHPPTSRFYYSQILHSDQIKKIEIKPRLEIEPLIKIEERDGQKIFKRLPILIEKDKLIHLIPPLHLEKTPISSWKQEKVFLSEKFYQESLHEQIIQTPLEKTRIEVEKREKEKREKEIK